MGDVEITVTAHNTIRVDVEALGRLMAPQLTADAFARIFGSRGDGSRTTGGVSVVGKTAAGGAPTVRPLVTGVLDRLSLIPGQEANPVASPAGTAPDIAPIPADAGLKADLSAFAARGLPLSYNESAGELIAEPSIDQRPTRALTMAQPDIAPPEPVHSPADLSAFLNARAAVSHVSKSRYSATGFTSPNFDFDGAVRFHGVVVEAEASLDTSDAFGGVQEGGRTLGFRRKSTRLVVDRPDNVVRFAAGDVRPGFTGFQTAPNLLGISAERSYAKLSPNSRIRPTSDKSFRIERFASVDIVIDDAVIRRLRLPPGNYNVSDLPLRPGANRVRLVIEEEAGASRTLEFTMIASHTLLAPGVDEWEFAAGVNALPGRITGHSGKSGYRAFAYEEPKYDFGAPAATMFYRLGVTPFVTVEAYAQGDLDVAMGGGTLVREGAGGQFAFGSAISLGMSGSGAAGFALGLSYQSPRSWGNGQSFKLAAEFASPAFATLNAGGYGTLPGATFAAVYTKAFQSGISAMWSANYHDAIGGDHDDYWGVDLSLSKRFGDTVSGAIALGYSSRDTDSDGCDCGAFDTEGFRALLRLSYRPDVRSFVSLSHETGSRLTQASYSRSTGNGVGAWTVAAGGLHQPDGDTADATFTATYTGNRGNVSAGHTARTEGVTFHGDGLRLLSAEQRTFLRAETGIAYADGQWALGRPVTQGFAIVGTHDALAAQTVTAGSAQSASATTADGLGPILVPDIPAYTSRRLTFEIEGEDDSAMGADVPPVRFHAPYKAGHRVILGSENSLTAVGTLIGPDGAPLALVAGYARAQSSQGGDPLELFTNRTGRFAVHGVGPGHWIIEIAHDGGQLRYMLDIPEAGSGLYQAGALRPIP